MCWKRTARPWAALSLTRGWQTSGTPEKRPSAIYGPLRDDISAFIKGGLAERARPRSGKRANAQLSEMAGQLKDGALKRTLTKGEANPETVRSMLFQPEAV